MCSYMHKDVVHLFDKVPFAMYLLSPCWLLRPTCYPCTLALGLNLNIVVKEYKILEMYVVGLQTMIFACVHSMCMGLS